MRKTLLLLLLFFILIAYSNAQLKYKMVPSTSTFPTLVSGNNFTWIGTSLDINASTVTPIGFTFNYNGVTYDSFQVTTDGFIRLGSGLIGTIATNALAGLNRKVIAPLWDDLACADSLNGNINYAVSGSAPNRILTVQWQNMKWLYSATAGNANFQVKLYENGGKIEYYYGGFGTLSTTLPSASIGMNDETPISSSNQATGTFLSINLGGTDGGRKYHQSMCQEFNAIGVKPDSGTLFTFTQVVPTPIPGGTYTIGGTGATYATFSEAAMALSLNGVSGPVILNARSNVYDDIFHLSFVPGTSSTNTVTLKRELYNVTLSPLNGSSSGNSTTAGDAIIRLQGVSYVTIDGISIVDNSNNLTVVTKFDMGIILCNSQVTTAQFVKVKGSRHDSLKNLFIDMNAQTGSPTGNSSAVGIRFGTTNSTVIDTSQSNSYNTIQDCIIEDFWRSAVWMYGFSGLNNPDVGNKITATGRNYFRDVNLTVGSALDVRCIEINAQKDLVIEKTDIYNIVANISMGTNSVYGIRINPSNSADYISGNCLIQDVKVNNLENQHASTTSGFAVGIECNRIEVGSSLTIRNCSVNDLYTNGSATARAVGMYLGVGAGTGTVDLKVYNNLIYDLRAPRATTNPSVRGFDIQAVSGGSVNADLVYNTMLIDNDVPPTVASHYSTNIYWANFGTSSLLLKNNIFVNKMSAGTGNTGLASVLFASANSNLLRLANNTNNNCYWVDTPGTSRVICYDGITKYDSMYKYINAVTSGGLGGPRDLASVTENPPFVSAITPYDLHINTTTATQIESGGFPVLYVTKDFDGNTRSTTKPDIGAYEFTGVSSDQTPPTMNYVTLLNGNVAASRTFEVFIYDRSGVAVGANKPRLYYKKKSDAAFVFDSNPLVSGNTYTFTFNYSLIGGGSVSVGDTIVYYLAAQDSLGNSGTSPAGGSGSNPPGTTAPNNPNSYLIVANPLSGDYTVGVSSFNKATGKNLYIEKVTKTFMKEVPVEETIIQTEKSEQEPATLYSKPLKTEWKQVTEQVPVLMENGMQYTGPVSTFDGSEGVYATITAAITDLNLRGVNGATRFLLTDTLYAEAGTMSINVISLYVPTLTNTVTFKPASGINCLITVNSTSPVFIINSPNIIFDGSNTSGGTTRNMFITNLGTGSASGVAFVSSTRDVLFKNLNGQASGPSVGYGIVFSDALNGKAENCWMSKTLIGLYSQTNSNFISFNKNYVGSLDTTTANKIQNIGIGVLSSKNVSVTGNVISGMLRATSGDAVGVLIGMQTGGTQTDNILISNNFIKDIKMTGIGAAAYGARGIRLANSHSAKNIALVNNVITDIWGDVNGGITFNPVGIYISSGGGYNIAYNSVNLFGTIPSSSSYPTAATAGLGINNVYSNNINAVNNIFANSQTIVDTGGKVYSIYSFAPNLALDKFDFNNLYVNSEDGRVGYLTGAVLTTLTEWKIASMKDYFSISGDPAFTDSINLSPNINVANSWLNNGNGYPILEVDKDILGNTRSNKLITGPTDIGAFEYTPNAMVNPPLCIPDGIPTLNTTQNFWLAGRPIAQIKWGNIGTVPSVVNLVYFSQSNPPTPQGQTIWAKSFWNATATGGTGFTYTIRFNYDINSLGALWESQMKIGKRDAGVWKDNFTTTVDSVLKTATTSSLNSFSDFALYGGIVPVELTSFTSSVGKNNVTLNWITASEKNNKGFEVERKMNGEWTSVGFVQGKGTTTDISNYSFVDKFNYLSFSGKIQYRLKQIDFDGSINISKSIETDVDFTPKEYQLYQNYPNPFNPVTTIKYAIPFESNVKVTLYNITGEVVDVLFDGNQTVGYYDIFLTAGKLASGVYFYTIDAKSMNGKNSYRSVKKMMLMK